MESKKEKAFVYPCGRREDCAGHYQRIRTDKQPRQTRRAYKSFSRTVGIWRLRQPSRNNKELLRRWIN